MNGIPVMWVVYDHPSDFPNKYVARKRDDLGIPTNDIIVTTTLDEMRSMMTMKGLTCITRSEDDDPVIVETWL